MAWLEGGEGDEEEIDLRGFKVKLTGPDDGLEWRGPRALCQLWQVELEPPVRYANTVQGSLGYDNLMCRRWFRGCGMDFRINLSCGERGNHEKGEIIKEDCVGA